MKVQSAPSSQNTTALWSKETTAVSYIAYKVPTLLCTALLLTVVTEGVKSWLLSSVTPTAVFTWVEFCVWLALNVGVHISVWWVLLLHEVHGVFSWHWDRLWPPKHLKHRPDFFNLFLRSGTDMDLKTLHTSVLWPAPSCTQHIDHLVPTLKLDLLTTGLDGFVKGWISAMCFANFSLSAKKSWSDWKGWSCACVLSLKWNSVLSFLTKGGKNDIMVDTSLLETISTCLSTDNCWNMESIWRINLTMPL